MVIDYTHRLGMLEFLGSLQKQLESSCKSFFYWALTATNSPIYETLPLEDLSYKEQANQLMKVMLLGMQRVMIKHQDNCVDREGQYLKLSEQQVVLYLHVCSLHMHSYFCCTGSPL